MEIIGYLLMHQTSLTKNDIKEYSITWGGLALIEFLVSERNSIGTKFKTWAEYQEHLKILVAKQLKLEMKEDRKVKLQAEMNDNKAALEVKDESVITDTNTVTSNND